MNCRRVLLLVALALPLRAQFVVKLEPQTVADFERYVRGVEAEVNERWEGKKNFLSVEDNSQTESQVLAGQPFIRQMNGGRTVEVTHGLIHDWMGAIYIPNCNIERVLNILQDFDNHKNIYPQVADSGTVSQTADGVIGYWRLEQKGIVPVVLQVEQQAHYSQVAPGKWKGQSYARDIKEIDMSLFTRGRKFPLGQGHGYLWRLYSYWSLENKNGGVLAECRTLSLSRDVPQSLAWAIAPYVEKMPRDSLTSTLTETRRAAAK